MIRILCAYIVKARGSKIILNCNAEYVTATLLAVDATSFTPVSSDPTPILKLTPAELLAIARPVKDVLGLFGGVPRFCFPGA